MASSNEDKYHRSGQGPWESLGRGVWAVIRRVGRVSARLALLGLILAAWAFVALSFYVENARRQTPRAPEDQWRRWKRELRSWRGE